MGTNLGDLLAKAGLEATKEAASAPEAPPAEQAPSDPVFGPKLVVRKTRKGRGGRTVTVIQGVESGHEALMAVLKKQLGVGARQEEDEVVLQGDQVERVSRWLESQPEVKKVVRG